MPESYDIYGNTFRKLNLDPAFQHLPEEQQANRLRKEFRREFIACRNPDDWDTIFGGHTRAHWIRTIQRLRRPLAAPG